MSTSCSVNNNNLITRGKKKNNTKVYGYANVSYIRTPWLNRHRANKLLVCVYVNVVWCCCQSSGHMLQQGLILYVMHEQGAGKHGPHWRAHERMARETNSRATLGPLKAQQTAGGPCLRRRIGTQRGNPPEYKCFCIGIHESQVRLGEKKCSIYTPSLFAPPDDPSRRIPDILLDLPCALGRRLGGGKQRRRLATCIFEFSSLPRRVIAVAHSHRVLATGPCWHSFSQRHVTASLHNSEARVLFRVSDWQSAAEARPKRSASIGLQ